MVESPGNHPGSRIESALGELAYWLSLFRVGIEAVVGSAADALHAPRSFKQPHLTFRQFKDERACALMLSSVPFFHNLKLVANTASGLSNPPEAHAVWALPNVDSLAIVVNSARYHVDQLIYQLSESDQSNEMFVRLSEALKSLTSALHLINYAESAEVFESAYAQAQRALQDVRTIFDQLEAQT